MHLYRQWIHDGMRALVLTELVGWGEFIKESGAINVSWHGYEGLACTCMRGTIITI